MATMWGKLVIVIFDRSSVRLTFLCINSLCINNPQRFIYNVNGKGGVEDTRHEAKAKDTTKFEPKVKDRLSENRPSRGQGPEWSSPRPTCKCSPKKKSFAQKNCKFLQNFCSSHLRCMPCCASIRTLWVFVHLLRF